MARKKQRETYGNGSIVQKKRNGEPLRDTWDVCISLGVETYTNNDGNERRRQRKVQRVVHGTLADARKVCRRLSEEYEHVDHDAARMTFADAVEAWGGNMREREACSPAKLRDYLKRLGYMAARFGGKPLSEVKKQDVEAALSKVAKERGFSARTTKDMLALTKRVFEHALQSDWIARNPCNAVKPPRVTKTVDRRSLSLEECARLRACLDRDEETAYFELLEKERRQADWGKLWGRSSIHGVANISALLAIRLLLATGMRRGEALGLTWEHVDFERSQVSIRQTLNSEAVIKEPKTAAGVRSLYVEEETMRHLRRWKEYQARILHLLTVDKDGNRQTLKQDGGTPVFCCNVGTWYEPHNLARWWMAYREAIGFSGLKMNELRHTQATQLLANGADIKTVQTRLGHSSAALTLDQYAHAVPANDQAAASLFGQIMASDASAGGVVVEFEKTA